MSWPQLELRECASFASGGTPNKGHAEYWGGEIPWVSSGEMTRQFLDDTSLRITEAGAEAGSRIVPAGTIFTVVRGMSLAKEFRISFAKRSMAFNQDLKALTTKNGIDPYFLFCSLRAHADQICDLATEAAHGTKKLEMERLKSFSISVPDLDIQKQVANCVRNYDELIENNRRRIALLEESVRLLYHEWFVKLRFPGHESVVVVNGVPEGWVCSYLGGLIEFKKGKKPIRVESDRLDGYLPHLLMNVMRGGQETEFVNSEGLVISTDDDTIMVMDGSSSGETFIGFSGAIGSTLGRYRVKDCQNLSPYWLYLMFNKRIANMKVNTIGAAIPHANKNAINQMEVLVPPDAINMKFDEIMRPIFTQLLVLRRLSASTASARDALLPKLMSGQLAV